jgi:hypothetical protein
VTGKREVTVATEREQFIVHILWSVVAPSLAELMTLDFVVLSSEVKEKALSVGDKIYQR